MPGEPAVQAQRAIAACPVRATEFFQQFRCISTGELVDAVSKDFSEILLAYYRKVLVRFRRS